MRIVKFFATVIFLMGLNSPEVFHVWGWDYKNPGLTNYSSTFFDSHLMLGVINSPNKNPDDCFQYVQRKIEIWRCGDDTDKNKWVSPDEWEITDVTFADFNRDGTKEFGLLVWRLFEPWPIEKYLPFGGRIANFHDQQGQSCHFILIGWDGDEYRELWAGSALADPLSNIQVGDVDGDGNEELIAIEGNYDGSESGDLTIWKWQGFGFSLVNRLEGFFSEYALIQTNNQLIILTD